MKTMAEPSLRRSDDNHFGVGDYVSRGDDDVHIVVSMDEDGFCGVFRCVKAPLIWEGMDAPWCEVGEEETNLCRRYSRVDYNPEATP